MAVAQYTTQRAAAAYICVFSYVCKSFIKRQIVKRSDILISEFDVFFLHMMNLNDKRWGLSLIKARSFHLRFNNGLYWAEHMQMRHIFQSQAKISWKRDKCVLLRVGCLHAYELMAWLVTCKSNVASKGYCISQSVNLIQCQPNLI